MYKYNEQRGEYYEIEESGSDRIIWNPSDQGKVIRIYPKY